MKRLWLILFIIPLFAQDINKHNISAGFFDDKTGFSLLSYSQDFKQYEKFELFAGFGTVVSGSTLSLGIKNYYLKSRLSIYSTFSAQFLFDMDLADLEEIYIAPTVALGAELRTIKSVFLKAGLFSGIYLDDSVWGDGFPALPFIGLNIKF